LPKLDLGFRSCEFLADACVRNKVATTFLSLKTLHLFIVDFNDDLMAKYGSNVPLRANSDYNTMGMLHLQRMKSSQVFSGDKGKLMFATKLLKLPRASPSAKSTLEVIKAKLLFFNLVNAPSLLYYMSECNYGTEIVIHDRTKHGPWPFNLTMKAKTMQS
ncbi:hypothetical protein Tco_1340332, partial [Tanacetum coccineum]